MDIISYNIGATANDRIEKFNANPDSTSGIVTVPKTIASGETVTVPAGRVAVLPNVQVDGTLNVQGEVFIPSGATLSGVVEKQPSNITVNVGPGGEYATINQALEYLSGFYPLYKSSGVTATINLKAGFVMNEQVLVIGLDLGWITIVGEDAETIITHTALTTNFTTSDYGFNSYPAFGVSKGGTSPRIGQLFRFSVEKVGGDKHGLIAVGAGSSADVLSGKGFIGAGNVGIWANVGSTISAQSANASNAGSYGICALRGSTINAESANASSAGTYGIYAGLASTIDAQGANASNAGTYGILAENSSTISAQSANASSAGTVGIVAERGSTINAYSADASNAGTYGVYAYRGSTINAEIANASSAGTHGVYALRGSTINVYGATIQNQTTGSACIRVAEGSHIEASGINTTGSTVTILNQTANTLTGNGIIYQ